MTRLWTPGVGGTYGTPLVTDKQTNKQTDGQHYRVKPPPIAAEA